MTKREAVVLTAFTQIMLCKTSDYTDYVEELMGRPVLTHELGTLSDEIKNRSSNEALQILNNLSDWFYKTHLLEKHLEDIQMLFYFNSNLTFPSGEGFYPDEKDGVKGYNTSSDRGADTFHPFKSGDLQIITDYGKSYTALSEQTFTADKDGTLIYLTPWGVTKYPERRILKINGTSIDIFTTDNTICGREIFDSTGYWLAQYPVKKGDVITYISTGSSNNWCCALLIV